MPTSPSTSLHIPFKERLKSIPEIFGIRLNEQPFYEVTLKDGPVEVRRYAKQLHASVTIRNQPFDDFRETAFKALAAYIFGANEPKVSMAMTAPVLEARSQPRSTPETIAMSLPCCSAASRWATRGR